MEGLRVSEVSGLGFGGGLFLRNVRLLNMVLGPEPLAVASQTPRENTPANQPHPHPKRESQRPGGPAAPATAATADSACARMKSNKMPQNRKKAPGKVS